jgi:glucose/arabinose dehydrogenase
MPSEGYTHSIGSVRAAADGTLWVSNGDGLSPGANPPPVRTYDPESMAGKILHIDRNGNGLLGHAFCPGETNLDFVCTKVHSAGFRNPFRFSLRPRRGAGGRRRRLGSIARSSI